MLQMRDDQLVPIGSEEVAEVRHGSGAYAQCGALMTSLLYCLDCRTIPQV
jgi:hypothetical protein